MPAPDPQVRARCARPYAGPGRRDRRADDLRPGRHRAGPATCSTSSTRRPRPAVAPSPRPTAGASRCCCRSRPGCPSTCSPAWQELRARPLAEQLRSSATPSCARPYVDAAIHADYARWKGVGAQARPPDFEGIRVYQHGLPPNPSVADVARRRGVHPAEAMIDLCVESGWRPAVHPTQPLPPGRRRCSCGRCATPARS